MYGKVTIFGTSGAGTAPKWLRLVKSNGGNYFGYYSSVGINWTSIGKQKESFPTNVTAGLIVISGSATILHSATFNNLSVSTSGGTITKSAVSLNLLNEEATTTGDKFAIYPNPSNGILEVRLPSSSKNQTISVFDINGREILKETMESNYKKLNLSHLSNGLYYIRFKEGDKIKYEKFIINK